MVGQRFSTFFDVQDNSAVDRKFDQIAAKGVATFTRIGDAARNASQLTNQLLSGPGTGGLGGTISRSINENATATRNATRAQREQTAAAQASVAPVRNYSREVRNAAGANETLVRSLGATSTALNVVQGPLGPLAGRVRAVGSALANLSGFSVGAVGAAALAFAVGRLGNEYAQTEGKLRPFFATQREVARAMAEVRDVANNSRQSLSTTADLYVRLVQNASNYNISRQRIGRITEIASKAATLSGGTAESQQAGLLQFSQAIGSNRLGGDELRSILENTTALANAIARGLGVTVGQLRNLGTQGVLTTQVVVAALERAGSSVDEQFSRLPVTLGAAARVFGNNVETMVGQFDHAIGLSSGLAHLLLAVGDNLKGITSLALGAGVAVGALRFTRWIGEINLAKQGVSVLNTELTSLIRTEATAAEQEAVQTANAVRLSEARIAGLRAERAAILQNIAVRGEELEAARAAEAQQAFTARLGLPAAGGQSRFRSGFAARVEQQGEIGGLQSDLAANEIALAAATTRRAEAQAAATTASQASRSATASLTAVEGEAASGTGLLAAGFSRIVGFVGVGGLVFAGVTALAGGLIYLATAESDADRATDLARESMESYLQIIDQTTGKVRDLTRAQREAVTAQAQATLSRYNTGDPGELENTQGIGGRLALRLGQIQGPAGEAESEAFNQRLAVLSRALSSNGDAAYNALVQIQRGANAGVPALQAFVNENQELIHRLEDLHEAGETAKQTLAGIAGALDPAAIARAAQAMATFNAELPGALADAHRQSLAMNTLNNVNRNQTNRAAIFQGLPAGPNGAVLSPEQINERMRAIRNFEASRNPNATPREIIANNQAHQQMVQDLVRQRALTAQVTPQVDAEARFRTSQETAQRDQNRAEAAQRAAEAAERRRQAAAERVTRLQEQRTNIIGRYTDEPSKQQTADQNIRQLQDIQRQLGDGVYSPAAMAADVARIRQGLGRELTATLNQAREGILSRYEDEPKGIVRAQRDIDTLRRTQQELGRGIYPDSVEQADEARIQNGLLRPFRDLERSAEQQRQTQLLTLQGREAEATALQKIYQLQESGAVVTAGMAQAILQNALDEQHINDLLAQRQRLLQPIQGSLETVRSSLETFLTDVSSNAPRAAASFFHSISANFMQIQTRQLVERITGGADERLRNLISGHAQVASASQVFAADITTTAGHINTLGTASQQAADALVALAQQAQRGPAGAIPGGSATTSDAAPGSALDTWLNAGSGPAGFQAQGGHLPPAATAAISAVAAITRRENLRLPFSVNSITSGFGLRAQPTAGASTNHMAIDFGQALGTAVHAAISGKVISAGPRGGLGNSVEVDSGGGLHTIYSHLSSISVSLHDMVTQWQTIGRVGATGIATGPHLDFRTVLNGRSVNPLTLAGRGFNINGASGQAQTAADLIPTITAQQQESAASVAGQMMAQQLAAMRETSVSQTAQALGAYDTVSLRRPQQGQVPSARDVYNQIGAAVGDRLDQALGTKFFKGIGGSFGTALQGAGEGAIASGFAKAIGIKQSNTGAQIGGAAGSVLAASFGLPPEVGGFIGGLIGGTIGGLFKKTPSSSSTVDFGSFGAPEVSGSKGTSSALTKGSKTDASSVVTSLLSIAGQLGGTVGSFSAFSIGTRKGKFILDPSGQGKTKGSGTQKFDDEQSAVEAALELAISRGAIAGISAASQRILKSGQDLQLAISKAATIESIPRLLLARTNPVLEAVKELNIQFTNTIAILKEAGATSEQFAQASQLYDLQRADAIKQAAQSLFGQIDDFITQLTATTQSPLNKATVYANAQNALAQLSSDVNAGKVVDQADLVKAAGNFEQASEALNGHDAAFFSDFQAVLDLLNKAKDNALALTDTTTPLPGSPFDGDPSVQQAIADQTGTTVDAINNQTDVLAGLLSDVLDALSTTGGTGPSVIGALPGFRPSVEAS